LVDKKKCDFRHYVLAFYSGTEWLYFYRHGYMRCALKDYDSKTKNLEAKSTKVDPYGNFTKGSE